MAVHGRGVSLAESKSTAPPPRDGANFWSLRVNAIQRFHPLTVLGDDVMGEIFPNLYIALTD